MVAAPRAAATTPAAVAEAAAMPPRLRIALVCASNQNRSMEAHALLARQGLDVRSYGTGSCVRLPGPSARQPNVYTFGTPYSSMLRDLSLKDPELYEKNGVLQMLHRNSGVKEAPERWQDNAQDGKFDVVLAFEERVFDMVVSDLQYREQAHLHSVLVLNLSVKDNHEEATLGARLALQLCQMLEAAEVWEDEIEDIIQQFEKRHKRKALYAVCFY